MKPDEFLSAVEAGEMVTPTDKNYKAYLGTSRKFYFQHFDAAQKKRFIELLNAGNVQLAYPRHFYVLPFFMRREEAAKKP